MGLKLPCICWANLYQSRSDHTGQSYILYLFRAGQVKCRMKVSLFELDPNITWGLKSGPNSTQPKVSVVKPINFSD